jgi:SOS response associated peptidase (SRAP)
MCGRVIQTSEPLSLAIVDGLDVSDSRFRPRYNAAPGQELLVNRQNHKTGESGERSLDLIRWGLIPYWCKDPRGGCKPINAKAESVSRLPMFRDHSIVVRRARVASLGDATKFETSNPELRFSFRFDALEPGANQKPVQRSQHASRTHRSVG